MTNAADTTSTATPAGKQTLGFQTEVKQLLDGHKGEIAKG